MCTGKKGRPRTILGASETPPPRHVVTFRADQVQFPYSTSINGTFSGKIPGWGKGELISVVTFAVVNVSTGGPAFHGPFGWGKTYPVYTISNASLTDITSLVQPNGSIVVRPTLVSDARYYLIQAFYATQPLVREVEPWSATPKTIFQNGSLATDHLSARGAKLITDFLEDYVLDDESKTLFKEVGGYFWEDSVEIDSYLYWTPGLHQMFQERYKVGACSLPSQRYLLTHLVRFTPLCSTSCGQKWLHDQKLAFIMGA